VLPHEALIRARLAHIRMPGLDIEDVIQETYARILSVPSLDAIRYPRQYAIQTARSIVIDHMRHSRVIPITSSGTLEQLNIALPEANTEERLAFQGDIEEVASALAQLPSGCRETLILRRLEGLSQKQTAQRLGVSEKTVEKYMGKGIWLLAELFGRGGKVRIHASSMGDRQEDGPEDEAFKPGD